MESIKKLFSRDQHKYTRLEQEKEHKKELKRVEYSYAITHTWRIPNFSSIINTELYLYSDVFAGGFHKWRMLIYPKGAKKDDQVSIFLRVADSGTLPIGWTRDVNFSLSIINEIDEHTVKHGGKAIFAEARTSLGFQPFMALHKLRRTDHRFLVKDTITVRAEVWFNKEQEKETPRIKEVHLSDEKIGDAQTICRKCHEYDRLTEEKVNKKEFERVENSYAIKYTWRIPNFSRINTDYLWSNVFAGGDHKWHLQIYPKGSKKDGNFSIYLCATHSATLPKGWTRDVAYRLSVISEIDEYTVEKELKRYYGLLFDEDSDEFDVIMWWKIQRDRFPILARMARDILSIPISSVASESVFSTAQYLINDRRASTTNTHVEQIVVLNDLLFNPPVIAERSEPSDLELMTERFNAMFPE